jgi:tetratricopeptide (TPR) repeat protein
LAIARYVRLALWPDPLVFDYGWPVPQGALGWMLPGALVLAALLATVLAFARRRAIAFAGAWFFLILAPSSSVLPITTELVAEHRMYLPLAAVIALVVLGAHAALVRAPRFVAPLATAVLVLALALVTRARNREYESEERLWRSVLAVVPENPRAHDSLGDELRRQGEQDEAREHFAEAVRLQPSAAFWRNNYGASLSAAGDLDGALEQWREAVRLAPDFAIARANLGRASYAVHDLDGALEHLSAALKLKPSLASAYRWMGFTLADLGRTEEAAKYLRAAIAADPRDADAQERLGKLTSSQRRSIRRE